MSRLNPEHVAIAKSDPATLKAWRAGEGRGVRLQLEHADLQGVVWSGVELTGLWALGADLSGAVFEEADLTGACFRAANLEAVTGTKATLHQIAAEGANFSNAYLNEAHLCDASLWGAIFMNASLAGANFDRARIGGTVLAGAMDLSQVDGLATVQHDMPSDIGTDTLAASRGRVPVEFLRGCGLTDWQIEASRLYADDLTLDQQQDVHLRLSELWLGTPMRAQRLFISYSSLDSLFVDACEPLLHRARIRFWRDTHDLKAGPIEPQLERALRQNPILLLVLSKASVMSDWVEWEASRARTLEKELGKPVLCPIALDDAWRSCPWSGPLRQQVEKNQVVDFSRWTDPLALEATFRERLLPGLSNYGPSPRR